MDTKEALAAVGMAQGGDEHLAVKFFVEPLKNDARSAQEGRPIFEDVEWISIMSPGSRNEVRRPTRPGDLERFPQHYARFKAREEQEIIDGTPLTEWTGITRSQAEELKFWNILTVEQLANCSDQNTQNFKGLVTLKQSAIKFLEAAEGKDAKYEELMEMNKALMSRIEELEAGDKPKRKRRTKAEMEAAKTE